ncbi:recombination protein NinB [Variovorax sp. PAMC26660]|uniref:recombination protein NinB n=1 Tax=Variovorax sp. PAMC26660 TaxID=2762322 RepID=UPI00164CF7A2|nr:recombination protein NinB [Variovorax sp. PAMC26660]QNK65884.1 recombination protein NinB [Variovorax sp. PAMC26660]
MQGARFDAFKHETKDDAEFRDDWAKFGSVQLLPALNHAGFVMVGAQSRKFSVKLASAFIEWLLAFGAEHNVRWSTPKRWGVAPQ